LRFALKRRNRKKKEESTFRRKLKVSEGPFFELKKDLRDKTIFGCFELKNNGFSDI